MKSTAIAAVVLALAWPGQTRGHEAARSGTFDSAGVSIAYLVAGKGEPVVLIHGLDASAEMNWQLAGH